MLDIILKIIGILGIIVLVLLCVILLLLLVVLFYPVTYRVAAQKSVEETTAKVKINWLFGLLRARFLYPEPGNFIVKLLWFTLYDSTDSKENAKEQETKTEKSSEPVKGSNNNDLQNEASVNGEAACKKDSTEASSDTKEATDTVSPTEESPSKGIVGFLTAKYEKIKYTFLKIYDKIKHIWENFTFYRDLLRDEQTKALLQHTFYRLKKIFKNIRPRKLKADIVFGTGSPDTTGYALAVYGMLSPMLGKHINITSDFTQSILLGDFYAAGHITIFQILFHSLMVVFDKRLKLLNTRIKKHRYEQT